MLKTSALAQTHMETRSLKESVPVLTDILALEQVSSDESTVALRHPNTDWLFVVHEDPSAPEKQRHNHWGVRVLRNEEIDAANQYLWSHQDEYGIGTIWPPEFQHGSYSVYFQEPGTNGWEIECFETVMRKDPENTRLGGARSAHWEHELPPERFPHRGSVPQALTHGTLATVDNDASARFYTEVLGLQHFRAYAHVNYVQHPSTKHYLVCVPRGVENHHSPNFRNTLTVANQEDLEEGRRWLAGVARDYGVEELGEIETRNGQASFLIKDLDANWWEIAAPA